MSSFFFSCFTGTFQFHMSLVKGFAVWHLLPLARKYLSSTTSSCFFMVRHIYSRFANSKLYSLFLCLQYHCVFIFYCSRHAINIFWMQSNRLDRLPRSWSEPKISENVFVKDCWVWLGLANIYHDKLNRRKAYCVQRQVRKLEHRKLILNTVE